MLQVALGRHVANDDQNQDPLVMDMMSANKRPRFSSPDRHRGLPSQDNVQGYDSDSDCEQDWVTDSDSDEAGMEGNQFKFV
jgi:hypothetical protein